MRLRNDFTPYEERTSVLRKVTNKINSLSGSHWTDLERVLKEYDQLVKSNIKPDVFIFSSLFKSCSERVPPAVGTAIGIWEDMLNFEIKPNTVVFNSIINVFASSGHLSDAEYYFNLMEKFDVCPDVQTFNSLINACSSSPKNCISRAEYWFKRLISQGLKPDEHTFNTLIAAAANAQDSEKGFKFFDKMQEYKVYSNMQTLTTVLKLCAQSSKLDKALQIFRMAEKNLEPDTVMWNSILNVCAKTGNQEMGFKLWNKMCSDSHILPDAASVNAILDLCGQKGDFDKLCDILAEAEILQITLNEYSLPTLINGCVKSGDANLAFQWFNLFKQIMPCNKIALCNLFRILTRDVSFMKISQTLFREALAIGIFTEHVVDHKGCLMLTGLPTDVAKVALNFALYELKQKAKDRKFQVPSMEVITGRGKMKQFCIAMSEEMGLPFKFKKNNMGRLIYPCSGLRTFLRKN